MSSAIVNPSQFIAMLEAATAEERAQIGTLFADMAPVKVKKVKAEPAAPVLAEGWALKPYEKGPKKGTNRWYHEENDAYTDVFPEARPAGKSNAASASASASAVVLPTKKRLSKEEKAALSPEQWKAHKERKAKAAAERKANRTPEQQAKIDERVAKMKAAREAKKAGAGGAAESASSEEEADE